MSERYRLECPNGHRTIKARVNGGYYCPTCSTSLEQVKDLKTGDKISSRSELQK